MRSRRASYLNPVRMYVFTSAHIFPVILFVFYSDDAGPLKINGKTLTEVAGMDSARFAGFTANINKEDDKPAVPMTRKQFQDYVDTLTFSSGIHFKDVNFRSRATYDSARASGARKDNWISRQVIYKVFAINEKYHGNAAEIFTALRSALVHSFAPNAVYFTPFDGPFIKSYSISGASSFYYVSHGIFSLHFYIFVFITMLFLFCIGRLNSYLQWSALSFIFGLTIFWLFAYEYIAMKRFYGQGWIKTLVKFILVNLLFSVVIGLLFLVFILFSFFKI